MQRFISEDPLDISGEDANLYEYVGDDPINYIDPQGLLAIYGNWCGPNWTGGREERYDPAHDALYSNPIDALDRACEDHDKGYYGRRKAYPCDKKARGQCMTALDRTLASSAGNLFHDWAVKNPLAVRFNAYPADARAASQLAILFSFIPARPGDDRPDCCKRGR